MPKTKTATVEIIEPENDDLLFASDMSESRRKRAADLVALNRIPSDRAIHQLVTVVNPAEAESEIRNLLSASREEDDQPFEFIPPKMKISPGDHPKFVLDSGESFRNLSGIVAISQVVRGWWPTKELSKMPPLCSSHDGAHGYFSDLNDKAQMEDASKCLIPHPAIPLLQEPPTEEFPEFFECKGCPMNQWATAPGGGRGKACRERRRLLLVLDGFQSPVIFSLPPTSVRQFDMMASGLKSQGVDYFAVRTNIELMRQQSNGNTYGVATFSITGAIDSMEQAQAVVSIRQQYAELIRTMPVEHGEFNESKAAPF